MAVAVDDHRQSEADCDLGRRGRDDEHHEDLRRECDIGVGEAAEGDQAEAAGDADSTDEEPSEG